MALRTAYGLSTEAIETLRFLFFHGPTPDTRLPFKSGCTELVEAGYAECRTGITYLNASGIQGALGIRLDGEKVAWEQQRAEAERNRGEEEDRRTRRLIHAAMAYNQTQRMGIAQVYHSLGLKYGAPGFSDALETAPHDTLEQILQQCEPYLTKMLAR